MNAAPQGAKVVFDDVEYVKGYTDQPTWIPSEQTRGFLVVIPREDVHPYNDIEAEYAAILHRKSETTRVLREAALVREERLGALSDLNKIRLDRMYLQVLTAPLSKKKDILKKIDKFLGL